MSSMHRLISRGRPGGWLVLRNKGGLYLARPFSSEAVLQKSPPTESLIPFLHSYKTLAPACTDVEELKERTEHVLTTQAGNLFQFDRTSRDLSREDRDEAWRQADGSVQMVEYLMRGYSAQIPGTLWNVWAPNATVAEDPLTNLETMVKLLDRMYEEGHFFMHVRKEHLSQLEWEEERQASIDPIVEDWRQFAREDTVVDDDDEEIEEKMEGLEDFEVDDDGDEEDDTRNDYALPGPTTEMYDVMLDSVAVTAAEAGDPKAFASRPASDILTAKFALSVFDTILFRHGLDGGGVYNDNPHTMPTQISFNAVIRTAANLYYDGKNEVLRDSALMAAFGANDVMTHSNVPQNSATYAYLIQVLAKYVPACESRGNMVHGLWKMARSDGVYNGDVQEAYLKASEPSNSSAHDEWIEANLRGKDWRTDAPQRWRRRVQKYRMVPRQTTY
jgi:hypothetical protein